MGVARRHSPRRVHIARSIGSLRAQTKSAVRGLRDAGGCWLTLPFPILHLVAQFLLKGRVLCCELATLVGRRWGGFGIIQLLPRSRRTDPNLRRASSTGQARPADSRFRSFG